MSENRRHTRGLPFPAAAIPVSFYASKTSRPDCRRAAYYTRFRCVSLYLLSLSLHCAGIRNWRGISHVIYDTRVNPTGPKKHSGHRNGPLAIVIGMIRGHDFYLARRAVVAFVCCCSYHPNNRVRGQHREMCIGSIKCHFNWKVWQLPRKGGRGGVMF